MTKVFLSTDSEEYSDIGKKYGAEVPFLRSAAASKDNSMEEDVLW
nr:acylneuraminate cytidylyltransferase family protein [Pectobacterium atrosepticum]